jgi:hypothetical protein
MDTKLLKETLEMLVSLGINSFKCEDFSVEFSPPLSPVAQDDSSADDDYIGRGLLTDEQLMTAHTGVQVATLAEFKRKRAR